MEQSSRRTRAVKGRARRDVAADLRGALTAPKATHHAAILDSEGAGRIMRSIDAYKGQRQTRLALAVLAHTFPRPGELRLATWSEIDLDAGVWSIPAARTKMRKPHTIPLSRQVFRDVPRVVRHDRRARAPVRLAAEPRQARSWATGQTK